MIENTSIINFDQCSISNDLWPSFINKFGIYRAKLAVRQSLDLQSMQGTIYTLPILIIETCGSALVSTQVVKTYIGLSFEDTGMLLIYSNKLNSIQLLKDN
tara:strand:- start:344 stop:646 length:303 start_codon:yes stop_codon:yes gene_type:complete